MKKPNIYEHLEVIEDGSRTVIGYRMIKDYDYFSKRYQRHVIARKGDIFDGATGAVDINSYGWVIHDVLKRDKKFENGSKCSNWKASKVLKDILKSEGRWFRARSWFFTTLVWGTFAK